MRVLATLLILLPAALADERFATELRAFEKARARVREPGMQAKLSSAVEALGATGDVRAVSAFSSFLVQTLTEERAAFDEMKVIQKEGARAVDLRKALEREISHLRLKERAGDAAAGPEIERRREQMRELTFAFEEVGNKIERLARLVRFVRTLREQLLEGATELIASQKADRVEAALRFLRQAFDIADREQALYLVRILGDCGQPEAEAHLVAVMLHPKAAGAVRQRACYAVVPVLTRAGGEAMLQLVRDDPEVVGTHALHAFSVAAKRRIADAEQAAAFVETLKS